MLPCFEPRHPLHYLALLERKVGALDQAAPLAGWNLPEAFTVLRRLLEARMGKHGEREFVQVLRLLEVFELEVVAAGVRDAIDRGAIVQAMIFSFDVGGLKFRCADWTSWSRQESRCSGVLDAPSAP